MFSITLKRSVATLGVVAGLLAAAGPASAATPGGVSGHEPNDALVKAPTNAWPSKVEIAGLTTRGGWPDGSEGNTLIDYEGTTFDVKAAVSVGAGKDRGLGRAGFEIGDELFETLVASEGVKGNALIDYEGTTFDVKANAVFLGDGLLVEGGH